MKKWIEIAILRSKISAIRGIIENGKDREWKIEPHVCICLKSNKEFQGWVVFEKVYI